jgi:hypothetical protein
MTPRALAAACAIALVTATRAFAQTGLPEVDDLKAPSTPAVTVLDASPASIERPDNPRAFIVNLASQIARDGGTPSNYGVAFTPYWMRWHPRLTFDAYARPTLTQRVVRTLSVSLASADWTTGEGAGKQDLGSRVALGFSTVPYQGAMDPSVFDLKSQLEANLLALSRAIEARETAPLVAAMKARRDERAGRLRAAATPDELEAAFRAFNESDAALTALTAAMDKDVEALQTERAELAKKIQELDTDRYGARLGIAGAWSWAIKDDALAETTRDRRAIWITPSYRSRALEIVGVARYLREPDEAPDVDAGAWDIGSRLVWQMHGDLAISGEAVKRLWRSDSRADTHRLAAVFEAKLGKGSYLFAALGRDYAKKGTRSTLVSLVGVNIGLGTKPIVTF